MLYYFTFFDQFGYMLLRQVGWFVVTVGMITAVPLLFEVFPLKITMPEELPFTHVTYVRQ